MTTGPSMVLDPTECRSVHPPAALAGSDPPASARSVEIGRLPSLGGPITGHYKISVEGGDCSSPDHQLVLCFIRHVPFPARRHAATATGFTPRRQRAGRDPAVPPSYRRSGARQGHGYAAPGNPGNAAARAGHGAAAHRTG